jgi:hypothetical protein
MLGTKVGKLIENAGKRQFWPKISQNSIKMARNRVISGHFQLIL